MSIEKLSDPEIEFGAGSRTGWSYTNGKLHKQYSFANFATALRFMTESAEGIESLDHHPEWLNVYNRVIVDLNTHDAGGVTALDFELADLLDRVAAKLQ